MSSKPLQFESVVEDYLHGVRVDSFLIKHFRNYTSYRMQRMVVAGAVQIEGKTVPLQRRVVRGERVSVRLIEPPDKLYEPELLPLKIVHEDEWLLVLDKPAGVVVHPVGKRQTGTLTNGVQHYLDLQTGIRGLLRPGIVHRLDRLTSGLIVLAKEHLAHRLLSIQFQRSEITKKYVALLEGCLPHNNGTIALPIGRAVESDTILMSAQPNARNPKPAVTHYEVIERYATRTLVKVTPQTGRNHQIRVHFATIGFPVVNDLFYDINGKFKPKRDEKEECQSEEIRHALHAEQLTFVHPITHKKVSYHAALPAEILQLCAEG